MTDKLNRLTQSSGYTINDVIKMSWKYYRSATGDNKDKRAKIDIKSARVIKRQNYEYNPSTKQFEQTGRDVKLEFMVTSDPKSYKKTDTIKNHKYPVTILIHDISKGIGSTFKWRTGGLKKPIFANPTMTSQQIGEKNIRNGCQMGFIYTQMWALKLHNLLYGRSYVNRPSKLNPKNIPFLDKHAWFIFKNIIPRLIGTDGGILAKAVYKNKEFGM
jgi:hypothetical protein